MKTERRNTVAGLSLAAAFLVSVIGDWFFENQWSNPNWYLFELLVWGTGFTGFFLFYRSDSKSESED